MTLPIKDGNLIRSGHPHVEIFMQICGQQGGSGRIVYYEASFEEKQGIECTFVFDAPQYLHTCMFQHLEVLGKLDNYECIVKSFNPKLGHEFFVFSNAIPPFPHPHACSQTLCCWTNTHAIQEWECEVVEASTLRHCMILLHHLLQQQNTEIAFVVP